MIRPDRVIRVAFAAARIGTRAGYGALRGAVTGLIDVSPDLFEVGTHAKSDLAKSEDLVRVAMDKDEALCLVLIHSILGERELASQNLRTAGRAFIKLGRLLEEAGSERIHI